MTKQLKDKSFQLPEPKSDPLYFDGDIWQDKMALSRPMMNFTKTFGSFRTFGSSAKRFSGAGEHPTGNYFVAHIHKDHF